MIGDPRNTCTRLRVWRCAVLAVSFVFASTFVLAQSTQAPSFVKTNQSAEAQVKVLTDRLAILELKLAKLDARVTSDESSIQTPDSPDKDTKAPSAPAGLSKSDANRLNNLEKQVSKIEADQKDQNEGEPTQVSHPHPNTGPTRVSAPFEVVDSSGTVIMSVHSNKDGDSGGLQMRAPDGSSIQIGGGTGAGGNNGAAVRVYRGPVFGSPSVFMGFEGDDPGIAILRTSGGAVVNLYEKDGSGRLLFANSIGKAAAFMGALPDNSGELQLLNASGKSVAWLGSNGGDGGLQLRNSEGKGFASLSAIQGNGQLDLMNPLGQTVALIGSNPANTEGHAVFTDTGGTPLAKIGAAGPHGDVLLGGQGKGIAVWEMTLTGFH